MVFVAGDDGFQVVGELRDLLEFLGVANALVDHRHVAAVERAGIRLVAVVATVAELRQRLLLVLIGDGFSVYAVLVHKARIAAVLASHLLNHVDAKRHGVIGAGVVELGQEIADFVFVAHVSLHVWL